MNIYKTVGNFHLSSQLQKNYIDGGEGGEFYFSNGDVNYIEYSVEPVSYRYFKYNDKCYLESMEPEVIPSSFEPYKKEQIVLKDESNKTLDLSPEKIYCIINNKNFEDNGLFVADIFGYGGRRRNSLAWFDARTDKFSCIEKNLFGCTYQSGCFYGLYKPDRQLLKIDKKFNVVWAYVSEIVPKKPVYPVTHNNTVIAFMGPSLSERRLVEGRGQYSFSGGVLVGLNDADGSVIWEKNIPNAVDEYKVVGEVLYVVSLHEILLIKPDNGEIINSIDTQTTKPFDRSFKSSTYVDESYIYYTHYEESLILMYDVISLALVKRVELPKGYHPKSHNFHDINTGKQYFALANRTQYVAQGPVLEIDPNNLDSKIEFEQEPEIAINMQPSLGNVQEQELLITLKSESLDDALRFGEIHTRDEAQRYSYNYMSMTFQDRSFAPEPNFNGVIRFVYSGCHQDEGIVNQHLRIMEKRFSNWVEKEGFYSCKDKQQFTKLVAEFKNG